MAAAVSGMSFRFFSFPSRVESVREHVLTISRLGFSRSRFWIQIQWNLRIGLTCCRRSSEAIVSRSPPLPSQSPNNIISTIASNSGFRRDSLRDMFYRNRHRILKTTTDREELPWPVSYWNPKLHLELQIFGLKSTARGVVILRLGRMESFRNRAAIQYFLGKARRLRWVGVVPMEVSSLAQQVYVETSAKAGFRSENQLQKLPA